MSSTIIDFWRAHPQYWIPITPAEKAAADKDIYNRFWRFNYTKENYIGQIIYHDQFIRHFQRLLGPTVITEHDVENARHQAIMQVCLHLDELKHADEIELVFALKSGGSNIKEADAYNHIYGFAVGLDMTRRDLQGVSKKLGRPWEIGKAFEKSAPIGPLTKIEKCGKIKSQRPCKISPNIIYL